jgi:hypothetical protein
MEEPLNPPSELDLIEDGIYPDDVLFVPDPPGQKGVEPTTSTPVPPAADVEEREVITGASSHPSPTPQRSTDAAVASPPTQKKLDGKKSKVPLMKKDGTPRKKPGRPKGSKQAKPKKIEIEGVLLSPELTRIEKLAILSGIARSAKASPADKIKATQAHTTLSGDMADGSTRYIIKVELL